MIVGCVPLCDVTTLVQIIDEVGCKGDREGVLGQGALKIPRSPNMTKACKLVNRASRIMHSASAMQDIVGRA